MHNQVTHTLICQYLSSAVKSGRGLPHAKMLRGFWDIRWRVSVLECASPLALGHCKSAGKSETPTRVAFQSSSRCGEGGGSCDARGLMAMVDRAEDCA